MVKRAQPASPPQRRPNYDLVSHRRTKVSRHMRSSFRLVPTLGFLTFAGQACDETSAPNGGGGGAAGTFSVASCQDAPSEFEERAPHPPLVSDSPDWRTTIEPSGDLFLARSAGDSLEQLTWVKFIVLAEDPTRIFYQNSRTYPFHFDFATRHIPPFIGMNHGDFDRVTLHSEGRQALLGTFLRPLADASEYGVQFASLDNLPADLVVSVLARVAASVDAPAKAIYFPTGRSSECIGSTRSAYLAAGVEVGSADRWLTTDTCYAPGWAMGKVVLLDAEDVETAYTEGLLTNDDILLLDGEAPLDLPPVAGILTLRPSTPNSHAAILAQSRAAPFAYIHDAEVASAARASNGKRVLLTTARPRPYLGSPSSSRQEACSVQLVDIERLSTDDIAAVRRMYSTSTIEITPKRASGRMAAPADSLVPGDIATVGGKAAHFGVLRAAIPEAAPTPAVAFTFDLWDAFMAMPSVGGAEPLRAGISQALAAHPWPPDLPALGATLEGIRKVIESADFSADSRAAVLSAVSAFDPDTRLRFRSSTNVEDSEAFTGAGLYDSVTGCLGDDLDADDTGPSACNSAIAEERGVFRALRRVYASFYARNAYVERQRLGVNEAEVGMAVLVHYSVPDEDELANGVATYTSGMRQREAAFVSQPGAASVTNPDPGALPEAMMLFGATNETAPDLVLQRSSSLLPLGGHVLDGDAEYGQLWTLLGLAADRYQQATGKSQPFRLDFEYKKIADHGLSVRQVRPLPSLAGARDVATFLVGNAASYCVKGTEGADVFATHRLKTRMVLTGVDARLTSEQLAERLYADARIDYLSEGSILSLSGDPKQFPSASHAMQADGDDAVITSAWSASGGNWELHSRLAARVARHEVPIMTPEELALDVVVNWSTAVPSIDFLGATHARTREAVTLSLSCPEAVVVTSEYPRVERTFSTAGGIAIDTSYWQPPLPTGNSSGYTAPVSKWDETTIRGLTTSPIRLAGYYSQTHVPRHHNIGGEYIFEPRLEQGLDEQALSELRTADIVYVIVLDTGDAATIWVMGSNGQARQL
jgi:hypothetical protein